MNKLARLAASVVSGATILNGAMCSQAAIAAQACPKIELAAVVAPEARAARAAQDQAGQPIALAADDLVSPTELLHANVNVTEGQVVLNLNFSAAAAKRVRDFTGANVGGRIALLVDGRAMKVVKILDPIRGDGILVGPVEPGAAEALAARINRCAPGGGG